MKSPEKTSISYFVEEFNKFFTKLSPLFIVYRRDISAQIKIYMSGLLRQIMRKNIEQINEYSQNSKYHALHHVISDSPWDSMRLNQYTARQANKLIARSGRTLVLDETSVVKKGDKSVGVNRQWSGRLGKIDNCQIGIYAAICGKNQSALIGYRLYLPEKWCSDNERCKEAGIPKEQRRYKSILNLGLELVDQANADEIPFDMITGDTTYGALDFAHQLTQRNHLFALDIHCNNKVYMNDPKPYVPPRKWNHGRRTRKLKSDEKAIPVETIFNQIHSHRWQRIRVWKGSKGYIYVHAVALRVYFWNPRIGRPPVQWWLVITRDEKSNEVNYFMSNAPRTMAVVRLVRFRRQRFWIERSFQDSKTSLGMAEYQTRKWLAWQHHMALIMLSGLFMLTLKIAHSNDQPNLSCQNIVLIVEFFLPPKIQSEQQLWEIIALQQRKRVLSQNSALKCQKEHMRNKF